MQTTAIRTVAYSLPENEVILLTHLISMIYISYTDLRKYDTATGEALYMAHLSIIKSQIL